MTQPELRPHRPANAYPELSEEVPVGPSEPEQQVAPQLRLAIAKQVHDVVTVLLNATTMLEAIPEQAWDSSFALVGQDLIDTARAAAAQSRAAYEKALAVEVMVARAMR